MSKPRRNKKRGTNGGPADFAGHFGPGNQAARGRGRPRKDFDLETTARSLSEPILLRYAAMGACARTPQDVAAGKIVLAYGFGSPRERKEISGVGGGPITLAPIDKMTSVEVRDELAALLAEARADGESLHSSDDDVAGEPE